ncbi:MAG: putative zinc-binding protein [Sedimentisphaerales bacterium]|nr:putative zinc-binding protein [Sedimentisphaerales bacterium]
MGSTNPHECVGGDTLIFACSGAADVGAISDRAARQLTRDGKGKMFCLAGIGGRVQGILDKTAAAAHIVAIDGCSLDCAKKTLEQTGFSEFAHVRVTDLGMEKGKAPVTDQSTEIVANAAGRLLS